MLFISVGHSDHEGYVEEDWIGNGSSLYWSHFDGDTNVEFVRDAGFAVDWVRFIDEGAAFGGGQHPFIRAHRL